MCGRYALALRPSEIRANLNSSYMPSQEAPDDDDVRQTYNFAPGYYGLVYRADVPDHGAGGRPLEGDENEAGADTEETTQPQASQDSTTTKEPQYKLQAMKWGLVPFWTKRNPDYGTLMRTINCRDDSLAQSGGMWASMKKKKRCIVIAQGFYEWLKKNDGKERIPHYTKRKDGQLMCFAGLWDCVKYDGDSDEKLYTYTIITTDVNKQLKFLHDRMPVILDNGSEEVFKWLDSTKTEWDKELQSLLKPYDGELECYQVSKDVGKVGNNSPTFIIPINSTENKQNIANFFGSQRKKAANNEVEKEATSQEQQVLEKGFKVEVQPDEERVTKVLDDENNAPKPVAGTKHGLDAASPDDQSKKFVKTEDKVLRGEMSPIKSASSNAKKSRSATSNASSPKGKPTKYGDGSMKITGFLKPT